MSPYLYPNPPKLSIYTILEWMQKQPDRVYTSKDLIVEFNISNTDAPTRLNRLRHMGLIKYYSLAEKREGYVLSDYGRRFKKHKNG